MKGSSEEFKWTQEQMKGKIVELSEIVEDLKEALAVAEKNPKMKVSPKELQQRKQFLSEHENLINTVKKALENRSLGSIDPKKRVDLFGDEPKDKYAKFDEDIVRDNQEYIDQVLAEQERIKQQQGQGLDQVIIGVDTLKEKAHVIGDTLDEHKRDLETFEGEAGRTKGLLQRANAQMNQLLKGSDKGKLICIAILVVIIVTMVIIFFALN